ncbi:hypothetical protein PQX77_017168 [Marasmius sp. AFHP31]|nr:hypothetical protein PQX77_017168 [Marasmius sp. AFHP31]
MAFVFDQRWTTDKQILSLRLMEMVFTVLLQYVGSVVLPGLYAVLSAQIYFYPILSHVRYKRKTAHQGHLLWDLHYLTAQVVWSGREGYNRFVSQHASRHWQGQFFVPTVGGVVGLGVEVFYAWRSAAAITAGTFGAKAGSVENLRNSPELPIVTAIWCRTSALCDILIAAYMTYLVNVPSHLRR